MSSNAYFDEKYMQLCSSKTLQTNDKGFFLDFAQGVSEALPAKWLKQRFGRLKTDREKLVAIYQDEEINGYVFEFLANVQEVYRGKCLETAQSKLEEGLKAKNNKENAKALRLMSQSVLRWPPPADGALFERAKLLFEMENYKNCLQDLQVVVKGSSARKGEAFSKMAICYLAQNEPTRAKVAANLAEKFCTQDQEIRSLHESLQKEYKSKGEAPAKEIPQVSSQNPSLANASHKLRVKNTAELGNFVVASEKIRTGEVLVVEQAYAACLLPEKFGTHCHHCFERLVAPMGCGTCASVAFCSSACQTAACGTYHKYECRFLDLLIGSGMSILSHTALRMITQQPLAESLAIYRNRDKSSVYNLCTNSAQRPAVDSLHRALMAAFLLRILQKGGYFGMVQNAVEPSADQLNIGEMLLYNLQMLQFNAHEIYETLYGEEGASVKNSRMAYIGVAVYPTVALFNHDCYPAVSRHFIGKRIVIQALRPLNPNDVIAENYGPIFTWRKLIDRQRSLSARYWFNCRCRACVHDWPGINSGIDNVQKRIRCPTKKCPHLFTLPCSDRANCVKCGRNVDLAPRIEKLAWCEQQYEIAFTMVDEGRSNEAVEVFCAALNAFHEVSDAPHKSTHLAQDVLRWCLAKNGNTFVAE